MSTIQCRYPIILNEVKNLDGDYAILRFTQDDNCRFYR